MLFSRVFQLSMLLSALALAGCQYANPTETEAPEDTETRLPEEVSADVAKWAALPREELAKLAAEREKSTREYLAALRAGAERPELLPTLCVPIEAPIWREAAYRPAAGFSLPTHVAADGRPDPAAALHLAAHGDHEAALKLADEVTRPAVEAMKAERSYPLEWTRLVALTLADAQIRLSTGDHEAAGILVRVHAQLVKHLDAKAKLSPLGSVLLGQGRRSLRMASRAWRDPSRNKTALADDIDKALAAWGDVPAARFPSFDAARLAGVFGKAEKTLSAHGDALPRVLDLLALPVPSEGLFAVGAFADDAGQLVAVQVAYKSGIDRLYPTPADLGVWLEARGMLPGKDEKSAALTRQMFVRPEWSAEVIRTDRTPLFGAVATLADARGKPAVAPADLRSFGPIRFDLPFSLGRDALSPAKVDLPLEVVEKPLLTRLSAGLAVPAPMASAVEREADADLVRSVRLVWAREMPTADAGRLAAGLWGAYGKADIKAIEAAEKGGLVFEWGKGHTRTWLRAPFDGGGAVLTAADTRPEDTLAERLAAVTALANKERRARIAAGKPDSRLAAGPGAVNGVKLGDVQVGQSKEAAEAALALLLPEDKEYRKAVLPDGVSVTILTPPTPGAQAWARQLLVRYAGGKVAEVRVRYQEGATAALKDTLLAKLSADPLLGPGEAVPGTWVGLWSVPDGSSLPSGSMRRWQDDSIVRTYQADAGGSEVIWRERPLNDAVAPRPWRFVGRGIGGVALGDSRAKVKEARGEAVAKSGGADVFRMPTGSPYEMLLVWWDKDIVARLVAVDRAKLEARPEAVTQAMQRMWGRDLAGLGFIRRQEPARDGAMGSLSWHDDGVRIQATARIEGGVARVMLEWRPWPLKDAPAAAAEAVAAPPFVRRE